MKKTKIFFFAFLCVLTLVSCQETIESKKPLSVVEELIEETRTKSTLSVINQNKIIHIKPLGYVDIRYIDKVKMSIKEFYGYDCVVLPTDELTDDILAASKTRYESSKILKKYRSTEYVLVITEKDIACKIENVSEEYGIFGMGYMPGKTTVVSTFRLKNNVTRDILMERLTKISLHELGHNFGLDHCVNNMCCVMRSGEGTVQEVDKERIWLCPECKKRIKY